MGLCLSCGNPVSNPECRCGECFRCPELEERIKHLEQAADRMAKALKDLLNHNTPIIDSIGETQLYQAHPEWAESALEAYQSLRASQKGEG